MWIAGLQVPPKLDDGVRMVLHAMLHNIVLGIVLDWSRAATGRAMTILQWEIKIKFIIKLVYTHYVSSPLTLLIVTV